MCTREGARHRIPQCGSCAARALQVYSAAAGGEKEERKEAGLAGLAAVCSHGALEGSIWLQREATESFDRGVT